jgi:hypothetical protein
MSQGDALPSSSAYGNKENQLQGPPPAISRGCRRRKWNNQWIINIPHKAGASSRPLPGVLRTAATRAGAVATGQARHAAATLAERFHCLAHTGSESAWSRGRRCSGSPWGLFGRRRAFVDGQFAGFNGSGFRCWDAGDRVSLYLQQARSAGMPRGRPSAMDLIPFSGVS